MAPRFPGNYTFVAGDHGTHSFTGGATLVTGHSQSITATDTSTSITGTKVISIVQPFAAGDLVVYRVGDGSSALTNAATAVFLDEYSPGGTLVQSIPMPTTDVRLRAGTAGQRYGRSEGQLNLSNNGNYLVLAGIRCPTGDRRAVASTASASVPRTIASRSPPRAWSTPRRH